MSFGQDEYSALQLVTEGKGWFGICLLTYTLIFLLVGVAVKLELLRGYKAEMPSPLLSFKPNKKTVLYRQHQPLQLTFNFKELPNTSYMLKTNTQSIHDPRHPLRPIGYIMLYIITIYILRIPLVAQRSFQSVPLSRGAVGFGLELAFGRLEGRDGAKCHNTVLLFRNPKQPPFGCINPNKPL